jgi:hypothetical protein
MMAIMSSYFTVSLICVVALRIRIHHSDPLLDRSIKIVGQLQHVFESCRTIFKEVGISGSHHSFSAKEGKTLKYTKTGFGDGALSYSQIFALCWEF